MVTEQFIAIIEQEDEKQFFPFLQSLTEDQKKKLLPAIKKLSKEYSQYGTTSNGTIGHIIGTTLQRELIQTASFVCFSLADYEKSPYSFWMLDKEKLHPVIDWYCPAWFSDFVNKLSTQDFLPHYLHYDWVMELTQRGFLKPSKELLVILLPHLIFDQGKGNTWEVKPENLLAHTIALEEHVWYLFELESSIHYSGRHLRFNENTDKEKTGWIPLFKKLSDENILDRARLLKESLLASNRNFNKVLSGWFSQLFIELEPAKEELLTLQHDLFSTLGCSHSKPVNTALQAIRKIISEKEFAAHSFLDAVPLLLSSDTKSTVITSLTILEKLAQQDTVFAQRITAMACQCFIQPEAEIQTKAARLIVKFGDATNTTLRQEITSVLPGLLSTARSLLIGFTDTIENPSILETNNAQAAEPAANQQLPGDIDFPANIDDLVFLASQAFDNNAPWHIDQLPAALVHFRSQLTEKVIPLFEPAFQRALGLTKNASSTTGNLDHLLATFFIDFGNWLIKNFPLAAAGILKIYRKYDTKEGEKTTSYLVIPAIGSYTAIWETHSQIAFYEPYKQLLLAALDKLEQKNDLPFLSTPSQAPCWISPAFLIDRLHQYQLARQAPNDMDLQVALSRVFLHNPIDALNLAKEKLSGEFRELVVFLLDEAAVPQKPFLHKAAWMIASLTRKKKIAWPDFESFSYSQHALNNYTGQLHWEFKIETYKYNSYNFELAKYLEKTSTRECLSVHRTYATVEKSVLKKGISGLLPSSRIDPPLLYELLHYRSQFLQSEHNDIKRILSLIPNNPEPILADTINKCLQYPDYWEEMDRKMVNAVMQFLHETWHEPGEMAYLMLGTCFFSADKTILNIAGEIWLKAVTAGSINNVRLGIVPGRLASIEFAPLKRFTDLISQRLLRVSDLHNRELMQLIESTLPLLPAEPVKNLKKLLELYRELLVTSNSAPALPELITKLEVWKKTAGLKKLIEQMIG